MSDLYRKEAFDSRIKGFSNPVTISGSIAVSAMLAGILVVIVGYAIFGAFTNYTRRAIVVGYLQPESGSVSIVTANSGQLLIEIANGADVEKGQRIARVREAVSDTAGQSLLSLEISSMERSLVLFQTRLNLMKSKLPALGTQAIIAMEQHVSKIELAKVQLQTREREVTLAKETLERKQKLFQRGLLAKAGLEESEQRMIIAQQARAESESNLALLKATTRQLELDAAAQKVDVEQSVIIIEREISALEGRLVQSKARQESGIFAPVSGTLTYATAQNGEVVTGGAELFQVTPTNVDMQATLLAPSSAIGFVQPNDVIQIRYSAFPYREHGVFTGTILKMDNTAQLPDAINAPVRLSEPVYQIVVKVDQNPISKSGQPLRLVPGMTLEASIIIDEKPLLFWLLDPVL